MPRQGSLPQSRQKVLHAATRTRSDLARQHKCLHLVSAALQMRYDRLPSPWKYELACAFCVARHASQLDRAGNAKNQCMLHEHRRAEQRGLHLPQVLLTAVDTGCAADALAVVSMVSSDPVFNSPV